jgi:NADH-quinone oxidoreductase subunit E
MKKPAGQDANATPVQPAPAAGDDPFGLAPWLKQVPGFPLHPLMTNPVAAMAATTAMGLDFAGRMAGLMLGMMQGTAGQPAAAGDPPAAEVATPEAAPPAERTKPAPAVLKVVPKTPEDVAPDARAPEARAPEAKAPERKAAGSKTTSEKEKVAEAKAPVSEARKAKAPKPVARKAPAGKAGKSMQADDLKLISGIGPKLEQVLHGMGLRRYGDIAALGAADVAKIEAELGLGGRIARDGWVEQAKALVKGRG